MIRVDATFSDKRSRVTINKREGNTENSRGAIMNTATSRMTMEKVRLKDRRISRRNVGMGITMTTRMVITPAATTNS